MNNLIINTANAELEIVLQKGKEIRSKVLSSTSHHNETMLPAVDELLKENNISVNDLNQLGVIVGPGSFTGIRVGIATIKAFRDCLNVPAKGINNLDYLFALATSQNKNCSTVAILGSRDSYFVATLVNNRLYRYERNLTLNELKQLAKDSPVGMFKADSNLNSFAVKLDANVLIDCLNNSTDQTLVPVYYQLSQAESEKIKRGNFEIREAEVQDLIAVNKLEQSTNLPNKMAESDFENSILSKNHKLFVALLDGVVVGFVMLELTDEINIENLVVEKPYRNYGIGTKLLENVADFAKQNGFDGLSLEVSEANLTAYLLYQKFGFVLRRTRKNYYADGSAALEMCFNILK